ncbi:MAG: YgjV family protein [Patescibacteria group bacterium]
MDQLIIQSIGFLALFFVVLSFQKNSRGKLLFFMLVGISLFVIHYALLGAWIGSLMNIIEAITVFVAYKKETDSWAQKIFWLYAFVAIFIIAGALTAKSLVDFLPVLAQIFGTIAVWQTKPRNIRLLMLVPRPLWLIYNIAVGSYAGITAEVFILLSVLVGILRFDILGKPEKHAAK